MRRILVHFAVCWCLCIPLPAGAQLADETLVPAGRARLLVQPVYTYWDQRFGLDESGATRRESLGADLTGPVDASLFPGITALEDAIRALAPGTALQASPGRSEGLVQHDVTRVETGLHLGVFDWLTVGVMVPWVKNRTTVDVAFHPDSAGGDVGLSPAITDNEAVTAYLAALSAAAEAAAGRAQGLCAADPGGAACAEAQALAARAQQTQETLGRAYFASPFFVRDGTEAATALRQALGELDTSLAAAGLGGVGDPVLSRAPVTSEDFRTLPASPTGGIGAEPLGDVEGLWELGDVELSALVRLAEGSARDSVTGEPTFAYRLNAGVLVRLGTGRRDRHDVILDLPTGDGQTDVEGRVFGYAGVGRRLALTGGIRFGIQRPTTILRRVAPPEALMAPLTTLRAVRWSPAPYLGAEVEPTWRFSEALSAFGSYRLYHKGLDDYQVVGEDPPGSVPVDPRDLERESAVTLHEVGVGLRYTTLQAWRRGAVGSPMELHLRLRASVAGSGGQTPVRSSVEFGVRFYRAFWNRGQGSEVPDGA